MIFLALSFSQNNGQIFKKGTKNTSGIYLKSDLGSIFYDFLYTVFLNDPTVFLLYFTGLRCSKQQEKHTLGNICRCFLRTLFWDGFGMTFSWFLFFLGLCRRRFWFFLDTVLASIFRGSPGLCQSQSPPGGGGDYGVFGVLKTSLQKQNS